MLTVANPSVPFIARERCTIGQAGGVERVVAQGDDERAAHRTAAVLLSDGEVSLRIDQSGQNVTIQPRIEVICRHIDMMATGTDETGRGHKHRFRARKVI